MPLAEKQYRETVNHIAFAGLAFLVLMFLRGRALDILAMFRTAMSERSYIVTGELLGGALYALMFCLPVLLFYKLFPRVKKQPMRMELRLPRNTLLYVFFGIAVVLSAAYANSMILGIFRAFATEGEEMLPSEPATLENYQLVLMFLTTAVIPAFSEEFFFRGMVLENLRPYGRTTAIFASALMFGLMHQNIEQIFYTVVAGVVIGWVYVCTESIWACILLHFVNNFTSVLTSAFSARLPHSTYIALTYTVDGVIFFAGILCGVLLFLRERDERAVIRRSGAFERTLPPDAEYATLEIAPARRLKLFFGIPMIAYVAVCLLSVFGFLIYGLL